MKRKLFAKTDLILILVLLLAAAALFLPSVLSKGAIVAKVMVEGETVLELDLLSVTDAQEFTLPNGVVLLAENQSIRFLSADCPDALCIQAGALSRAGEVAACVPNKTVVSLHSTQQEAPVDGITY